jgi:hypothetical protein
MGEKLDGGEFGAMVAEWSDLEQEMLRVKAGLPEDQHSAYLQLVEHPIAALSNLYQLYYAVALNRRLAQSRDARANFFADKAESSFRRDQELTHAYHLVNGGKWDGMMSQTHIGYTGWQQPATQVMPEVKRIETEGAVKPIEFTSNVPTETAAVISIEAPRFSRAVNGKDLAWRVIPHLGRTLGSVIPLPQGRGPTTQDDAMRLEYDVAVRRAGDLTVQLYLSPTLDTTGRGSQRIGVSIDTDRMHTLVDKLLPGPTSMPLQEQHDWSDAVEDNARVLQTTFTDVSAGPHVIKIWRLDDNVVLQKIVASTGPIPLRYLGPPANTP